MTRSFTSTQTYHVQTEPLIHWPEPIIEYLGFVAQFLAVGSVGFRYAAVRGRLDAAATPSNASGESDAGERRVYADTCARAAAIGAAGAVVGAMLFASSLPERAARAHTSPRALLTNNLPIGLQAVLTIVGIIGLVLAARRWRAGWAVAATGVIFAPLSAIVSGQWLRLVNPIHRVVGGLWLGTLCVLLVAGLAPLLHDDRVRDRRGAMAADMVHGFSPLALWCGMLVVVSGLVTSWRHLNPLSSLWTTAYGWVLIVKLALVTVVFGLGAWNWRWQRPSMGSESAAITMRRSATRELVATALVLAATAILLSIPSPRPPRPPGQAPSGAPARPAGLPPS
ncbi:MAG: CopD family protein [Gemmatimonadaceae bacterium]